MDAEDILEFANHHQREQEVEAVEMYRQWRRTSEERLHEGLASGEPAETSQQIYDLKMLQATEALAYVFYLEHGRPIDGDESDFNGIILDFWPDYAAPAAMGFGAGPSAELDDYTLELPLRGSDCDLILAMLRVKFPLVYHMLGEWLLAK